MTVLIARRKFVAALAAGAQQRNRMRRIGQPLRERSYPIVVIAPPTIAQTRFTRA
jgi:hypothetical protein